MIYFTEPINFRKRLYFGKCNDISCLRNPDLINTPYIRYFARDFDNYFEGVSYTFVTDTLFDHDRFLSVNKNVICNLLIFIFCTFSMFVYARNKIQVLPMEPTSSCGLNTQL